MPHATSSSSSASVLKETTEQSAKPDTGVVRTIEEQVQLVRVFRLLAFEIPLQLVERKLEKGSAVQRRKSCADYELKQEQYVKERSKFLATLQEETNNGREMVCAKYQITAKAIAALVEQLGGSSSALIWGKSHIEDLIWEVNDNLDGMISFEEFERSYARARRDRTGLEPLELFSLIDFLMFDKERSGRTNANGILLMKSYLKYSDAMEKEVEIHFGSKLDEGAQFILFSEFYDAILKRSGELIDQQASISKSNKYCKKL